MDLKYPRGENVWVNYKNPSGDVWFIITSKPIRDYYYLYELQDGEFKKLGKAREPPELVEKYKVLEKIQN